MLNFIGLNYCMLVGTKYNHKSVKHTKYDVIPMKAILSNH